MDFPWFVCSKCSSGERNLFIEFLNTDFVVTKPYVCPYCSRKNFLNNDRYFQHVLNGCKVAARHQWYLIRHDEVLAVFVGAAVITLNKRKGWEVYSVVKDSDFYRLPHPIRNQRGNRSPDLLIYNRSMKLAMIVELIVTLETDILRARMEADEKVAWWKEQFEACNYTCFCFSVEIGCRGGFVSSSFVSFLKFLGMDEVEAKKYALMCQRKAFVYSQFLLDGHPRGYSEHR